MTEPSDEELERAERIRKLRSGGARSRGHRRREERWDAKDDPEPAPEGGDDGASASGDGATGADDGADGDGTHPRIDTDVVELAEDLPERGSLLVVPVRSDLRRRFTKVAEQLHLRYGFEHGSELDVERHLRPLALYLGVRGLEDADVDDVRTLLESVEELDAPGTVED